MCLSILLASGDVTCCRNLDSAFGLNPSQPRAVIAGLLSLKETLTNNTISHLLKVKCPTSPPWLCNISRTSSAEDEAVSLPIMTLHPKALPLLLGRPCIRVRPEP